MSRIVLQWYSTCSTQRVTYSLFKQAYSILVVNVFVFVQIDLFD